MSDSESVDYLETGFDAKSLTIPKLRSILVKHDIQYPSQAKKQDLVNLFNEEVAPQAKKLLAKRARVKRMSQGIVDAQSQESISTRDEDLMPPPPKTRARSPRKTTRVKSETPDTIDFPSVPRESPRKRSARSTPATQGPSASDTDTGTEGSRPKSARKPRQVTPAVKLEPPEDDTDLFRRTPGDETVFSDDNPFQSGSSPAPVARTPSNRRVTHGGDSITVKGDANARKSATPRRRTDGPVVVGANDRHVSARFEIPVGRSGDLVQPEQDEVEAGEEFTAEEQLELTAEERANPERAVAVRRKPESPARRINVTTPLWVLLITLLSAYAGWYRQEKVAVGYCGLGRPAKEIIPADFELPQWAEPARVLVEPQCEPCPMHASCYSDYSVSCDHGFVLKQHPLAVGGIIPIPPTCEPDSDRARHVHLVADRAVEELRERRAKFECGELTGEEGLPLQTPAIGEDELKEIVSSARKQRSRRMTDEEFDDLWTAAIGEIKARDEIEVQESGAKNETGDSGGFPTARLSSTSLARVPISCAFRRSIRLGLERYRVRIGGVILSLLSLLYARSRYLSNRKINAQIPALVDLVLDRLATQKELAFEGGADDAFLFLPNLRDDVLRSRHSVAERERIWKLVRAVVEQNSNVRTGQRESHDGELGRAWEWIGPSSAGAVDTGRRRRSGRVSWGPDVKESIEDGDSEQALVKQGQEMSESKAGLHKRWEESRPIY